MGFHCFLCELWRGAKALLRTILAHKLLDSIVEVLFKTAEKLLIMGSIPLYIALEVELFSPLLVVGALVQVFLEVAHLVHFAMLPKA